MAVHGIGADPDWTWVADGVNWLEKIDMLPKAIPNARILRFGYDSTWYGDDAVKQGLRTVATGLLESLKAERLVRNGYPTDMLC